MSQGLPRSKLLTIALLLPLPRQLKVLTPVDVDRVHDLAVLTRRWLVSARGWRRCVPAVHVLVLCCMLVVVGVEHLLLMVVMMVQGEPRVAAQLHFCCCCAVVVRLSLLLLRCGVVGWLWVLEVSNVINV